jgi:hypothetical protein
LWRGPSAGKVYVVAVVLIYVPLFLCALMSPLPVAARTATLHLPFLYDWNVAFTFLVSFPSLLVLTVTDQCVLASSLGRVQTDGILTIPEPVARGLSARWCQKFRRINIGAQLTGALVGLLLSVFNYRSFRQTVGSWVSLEGHLTLPVGLAFLFCIFLFYFLVSVYVLRSFGTSMFLKDLVAHAQIRIQPFHPDGSGGLRAVGHLGLRNQYGLTVCGVNLVLLVFVYANSLTVPPSLDGLMVAAAIAYIIVGPIVVVGPLLPFRTGMLRTKTELLSQIA